MFTGIVTEVGRVESARGDERGVRLQIRAPETAEAVRIGDSVSVSGVCLTVVEAVDRFLSFDAVPETLARTSLGRLGAGDRVNLEQAVRAGEPLGGHIVQGHVDAVGRVARVEPEGEGARIEIDAPADILRLCVEKGSIAVDGVSLTIAALGDASFEVALVPHTLQATTLGHRTSGDDVNLEGDLLAKYIQRLLAAR